MAVGVVLASVSVLLEQHNMMAVTSGGTGTEPRTASAVPDDDGLYSADGHDTGLNAARRPLTTPELFLKDAFLIFHSMCKLTMKSLVTEHQTARPQVAERLTLLSLGVLQDHTKLRSDTQAKNIATWTPVVGEILHEFCGFDDKAFMRYVSAIHPLAAELVARETSSGIWEGLRDYFVRAGRLQGILDS